MSNTHGSLSINSDNIFPIIKKWMYSDHDIFYRELISNGCDAITKLKKLDMIGEYEAPDDIEYKIDVKVSANNKTIKIIDNGIGMTDGEVEEYINQIAFSGAEAFLEKYKDKANDDQIIGHFGLGFYSAFMVADKVTIDTLSFKEGAKAVHWECDGGTEYDMSDGTAATPGTTITLYLNEDSYEFANEYKAREVVEKYCSFMPVPIFLTNEDAGEQTEEIPEEEITSSPGELSEEEKAFEEQIAQEESPKLQEISEGFDIDFYVIIDGNKVKLQHNDITGIATWKDGRTTYHGVSVEDLLRIYEEFGFVKNSESQNPDAIKKFVSAYRGKSRIEYGEVYTDTKSGKTYVSYNYGQNKQGEAVDVYYLPNGKGVALNLKDSVKKDNSFYSVEVKGEGQDRIRYALTGTVVEEAVADFNPKLPDQTDQIEWTCMGTDDKVIDGIRESGNQTRFAIGKITQSYVIQRADQTAFDIQFYIYVDNEVRKLPADSLKKVYKWNRQGRCYLSVSDLAEIYREFGLNAEETQSGHYFPYTVRGEKTLAQATVVTYKGQQYVSYNLDKQEATVPTDVYYMPKGASDGEKIPDNYSDQIKQNQNSFYSVTVINPDGNRTVSYYKKDSAVTISVDPGDTKESDWLCASEDENKTISPVKQGDKLTFSIGKIEQPYTVACNTFAPATLNIKFYTFVNNERYNVLNEEIPVIKDTTTKPGTVYYYISNDELKRHFEKFHYDGSIQNGAKERFYYSKRD